MKKLHFFILLPVITGFVSAAALITLPDLHNPGTIRVDQKHILIADFPRVLLYSASNFKLLTKFGTKGEGPGEFLAYVNANFHPDNPDYIVTSSSTKVCCFTRDGKFVNEIKGKKYVFKGEYWPIKKNFIGSGHYRGKDKIRLRCLNIFNSKLEKTKEFITWKLPNQDGKVNPTDTDNLGGEFVIHDNKVFVLIRENGAIRVFDESGNNLFSIDYDYHRVPITGDDRQGFINFLKKHPVHGPGFDIYKRDILFPKYYFAGLELNISDNKMYVLTRKQKEGRNEFIVFDINGKFLKKIMLPIKYANIREHHPFTIHNEKLFQLIENQEEEEWELHIHKIQ